VMVVPLMYYLMTQIRQKWGRLAMAGSMVPRMLESMWSSFISINHFLCWLSALKMAGGWKNSIFRPSNR